MSQQKKLLITICSKNPDKTLLYNLDRLNTFFNNFIKKICIVDSDSNDFSTYEIIRDKYPDIDIYFIQNKNYEYGAYKYSYSKNSDYDIYCCIQDSYVFEKEIDISSITDNDAFIYYNTSGFYWSKLVKKHAIRLLENVDLNYSSIIDNDNESICNTYNQSIIKK